MRSWKYLLPLAVFLLCWTHADALIMARYPLKDLLKDSQFVVVAKIDKVYPDKPAMMLNVTDDLKGKAGFRKVPVLIKGDAEAEKHKHVEVLMKHVAEDVPVVLFVKLNKSSQKYETLAYTEGTWFFLLGHKGDGENVTWSFAHCEPYLRKTYSGTTAELKQVLADVFAGKRKAPEPNDKEAPGFGPEVKK